jgi:exopolysaccharide production protein ExoQ
MPGCSRTVGAGMTIPRHIVRMISDGYIVFVVALSTDPFLTLLIGGNDPDDTSQGSPVMRLAWAIVYAITLVQTVRSWHRIRDLARANKSLVFLVGLTFMSAIWSLDRAATLHASVILLFTTLFCLDVSTRYTLERQLQLVCIALGTVICLSVLVELFSPGLVPGVAYEGAAWHGAFGAKNEFGRVVTIGVATFLALPNQRRWTKAIAIGSGVLLGLLAQSAGATGYLVGIALLFLWLPVLKWKPRQRKVAIAASAGVACLMVIAISLNWTQATALVGRESHLSGRTLLWRMSLASIQEKPLLGYGYAAFWTRESRPARLIREESGWDDAPHSHNGYIEIALGLGVVGLAAYAAALTTNARRAYMFWMSGEESFRKWPLAYLVLVSLYQLTESSMVTGNHILWILYGWLAFSLPQLQRQRRMVSEAIPRQEFARSGISY